MCLILTLVCILFRSALCTSDDDSGKISRRAHLTDCHEICTEFVFCGYFEHTRNTQIVKVLFLAANTVTHIIHIYTCLLSMQKKTATKSMWAFHPSSVYSISLIRRSLDMNDWHLVLKPACMIRKHNAGSTHMLYHIKKRLKMASWNMRSIMRLSIQKITNNWKILFSLFLNTEN